MHRYFFPKAILQARSHVCIKGQQKYFTIACLKHPRQFVNAANLFRYRWCSVTNRRSLKTCNILRSEFENPPKKESNSSQKFFNPPPLKKAIIALGLGAISVGLFSGYNKRLEEKSKEKSKESTGVIKTVGKAKVGGPFELTDHNGKPCSSTDFLGQWVLIYFGFTHCPDICPDEIEKMITIADILERKKLPRPQTVFISVDSERDKVPVVAAYVKEFSSKLIGLTGTKEQIQALGKLYHVYYSPGPKTEDNDYTIDHTIIIYAMDPNGEFVEHYGLHVTAEEAADSLAGRMAKHRES